MEAIKKSKMIYRYLGNSGLRVSVMSWGNWLNSNDESDITNETVKIALENGINFFDTAEAYGFGKAETLLGEAFKKLGARREDLVVSTKIFKSGNGVNDSFLSRKHIIEGVNNSLKRLQMDYVDVLFCHRPDSNTPMEETCRALNWVINQGKAFYWGTSEWTPSQIGEAHTVCEKLGLIKPIVEQCQYSMLHRQKVEQDHVHLFKTTKMGTTVWSPLFEVSSPASTSTRSLKVLDLTLLALKLITTTSTTPTKSFTTPNSSNLRLLLIGSASLWPNLHLPGLSETLM